MITDATSEASAGRQASAAPRISVIIVNWNTRDLLKKCLASVWAPTDREGAGVSPTPPVEVIVVDNASSDGSQSTVRTTFPHARLIENDENVGFARANNQGIAASSGRYLLLLNSDAEVRGAALEMLADFMESNPTAGAAGARLLNADGTLQVSGSPAPSLTREMWRLFHLDSLVPYAAYPAEYWESATPQRVDVAQGACLILRRKTLEEIGLLDESYFMYSEEVDLCHRIRLRGWEVYWVPRAEVVHLGGRSTCQASDSMFIHLYTSKVRFFRKHHGRSAATRYKVILLLGALARLVAISITLMENPQRRRAHLSIAAHYVRLLRALPSL